MHGSSNGWISQRDDQHRPPNNAMIEEAATSESSSLFFFLQASALTPEAISMIPARQAKHSSGVLHLLFQFYRNGMCSAVLLGTLKYRFAIRRHFVTQQMNKHKQWANNLCSRRILQNNAHWIRKKCHSKSYKQVGKQGHHYSTLHCPT